MFGKNRTISTMLLAGLATVSIHVYAAERSIYVMTNDYQKNEIVRFQTGNQGALLSEQTRYDTGGLGSGPGVIPDGAADPLGSQGSVTADQQHRLLFAVNAGSNQLSVFQIADNGELTLAQTIASGGEFPVSQFVSGSLVYVLNAGSDGDITVFEIGENGKLSQKMDWTRSLHLGNRNPPLIAKGPAQVQVSPDGKFLVVTVREVAKPGFYAGGLGKILVFPLNEEGKPADVAVDNTTNGAGPYAFNFDSHGYLIVSEVRGGGQPASTLDPNSDSAIASYRILPLGTTELIDHIVTHQGGACWVEVAGKYAYTTNTDTNNLTGVSINKDGTLSLLNDNPVIATPEMSVAFPGRMPLPLDFAISQDGDFMYILQPGTGSVSAWSITRNTGELKELNQVSGLAMTPITPIDQAFQPGGANSGLAIFEADGH